MKKTQKNEKPVVATAPKTEPKAEKKPLMIYPDSTGKSPKNLPKNATAVADKSMQTNLTPMKVVAGSFILVPAFASGWSIGKDITNTASICKCADATKKEKAGAVAGCIIKSAIKLVGSEVVGKATADLFYDNFAELRK